MIPESALRQLISDGQGMAANVGEYTEPQVAHMITDLASQLEQALDPNLHKVTYWDLFQEISRRQRVWLPRNRRGNVT